MLLTDTKTFMRSQAWYKEAGIQHKRGYLRMSFFALTGWARILTDLYPFSLRRTRDGQDLNHPRPGKRARS